MQRATLGCSAAVVTMRLPRFLRATAAPNTAVLLASVPEWENQISSGLTPIGAATSLRAFFMICAAAAPIECRALGLP